jgi:Xaa-Pro aminopeptidase
MVKIRSLSTFILALAAVAAGPTTAPLDFDKSEYAARRQKLMARIPDGLAIIQGSLAGPLNNEFIQNNEFNYLCGVKLPRAVFLVDGIHKESILFYTTSERYLRNEGVSLDLLRDPKAATGVDRYYPADEFTKVLAGLAAQAKAIYTPVAPEGPPQEVATSSDWDGRPTRERQFAKMLQQRFPNIEVRDCTDMLWDLRRLKTPAEIDVLREASQISVPAMTEVMQREVFPPPARDLRGLQRGQQGLPVVLQTGPHGA